MLPPYDSERRKLLKQMIFEQADPPDIWIRYPVTIRGGAGTFRNILLILQTHIS